MQRSSLPQGISCFPIIPALHTHDLCPPLRSVHWHGFDYEHLVSTKKSHQWPCWRREPLVSHHVCRQHSYILHAHRWCSCIAWLPQGACCFPYHTDTTHTDRNLARAGMAPSHWPPVTCLEWGHCIALNWFIFFPGAVFCFVLFYLLLTIAAMKISWWCIVPKS